MTMFIYLFIGMTLLYVIYYAVMISLDLRAKEKLDAKEEEESFDVSDIAGKAPSSITVKTTSEGSGFQVGDNPPKQLEIEPESSHSEDPDSAGDKKSTEAERRAEECQNDMEEISPMDNDEFSYSDGSISEWIAKEQQEAVLIKENSIHNNL